MPEPTTFGHRSPTLPSCHPNKLDFELALLTQMHLAWIRAGRSLIRILMPLLLPTVLLQATSNHTFQFTECLDPSECYEFVISYYWGDDIICCHHQDNGIYNVSIN